MVKNIKLLIKEDNLDDMEKVALQVRHFILLI